MNEKFIELNINEITKIILDSFKPSLTWYEIWLDDDDGEYKLLGTWGPDVIFQSWGIFGEFLSECFISKQTLERIQNAFKYHLGVK